MSESSILFYVALELAVLLLLVCVFLIFHVAKLNKVNESYEEKILELSGAGASAQKLANKINEEENNNDEVAPTDSSEITPLANEVEALPPQKQLLDFIDEELQKTKEHHQTLSPDQDIVLDIGLDSPIERQAVSLRHAFLIAEKEACSAGESQEPSWDVLQAKLQQIIRFYCDTVTAKHQQTDQELNVVQDEAAIPEPVSQESVAEESSVVASIHVNQQEIQRLSHLAEDHFRVMDDLKAKLLAAESPDQHQEIIAALSQELEQQQRLLKETETCTQVIETELARALEENEQLRTQLDAPLQNNNTDEHAAQLQIKLTEVQQELLNLQTQHIELEERYGEIKS